jgi:hypothetical protein
VSYVEDLGIATMPHEVPPGICGVPYSITFQTGNGTGLETWAVVSGSLPPGLSLSSSGQLSGTPSQTGVFAFRLGLQGGGTLPGGTSIERDFTIVVNYYLQEMHANPMAGCRYELVPSGGWAAYEWLPGGETTASIVVEPETTTTYGVLLDSGSGCIYRAAITVPATTLIDPACDAPTLTSVTPDSGPATGGMSVTLLGAAFDAPAVYIGDTIVPSAIVSDQELTATTASMPPGSLNHVLVRNDDGGSAGILRAFFADFLDVDQLHPIHDFVEALVRAQVTAGCGGGNYCPDDPATREQMAVFLLRSKEGPSYTPPGCITPTFDDVPCSSPFAPWIEELVERQVTAGCGGGNYCPADAATREQMAVFLLRTLEGPSYTPPACVTPTFADVPCSSNFARWIEELVLRGITAGCGGGLYCPLQAVSRGQMAVFLTATFDLP